MAYDKKKIYLQAQEQIKKHNLFFIEDIVAFIPCDKTTFYKFFPVESNELNALKELLSENKIKTKSSIRSKLYKGRETGLLALYKLIGTDEERKKLSQVYQDVTTNGKDIKPTEIVVQSEKAKENIKKLMNGND